MSVSITGAINIIGQRMWALPLPLRGVPAVWGWSMLSVWEGAALAAHPLWRAQTWGCQKGHSHSLMMSGRVIRMTGCPDGCFLIACSWSSLWAELALDSLLPAWPPWASCRAAGWGRCSIGLGACFPPQHSQSNLGTRAGVSCQFNLCSSSHSSITEHCGPPLQPWGYPNAGPGLKWRNWKQIGWRKHRASGAPWVF